MYHCSGFGVSTVPTCVPYVLHLEGAKSSHRFFFLLFSYTYISRPRTAGGLKHIDDLGMSRHIIIIHVLQATTTKTTTTTRYISIFICQTQVYIHQLASPRTKKRARKKGKRRKEKRERGSRRRRSIRSNRNRKLRLSGTTGFFFSLPLPCTVV